MAGEPVTVTAAGVNFNPKHTLTYRGRSPAASYQAPDTQTVQGRHDRPVGRHYTANATITDPKGPKDHNVASCGANFNVNVPTIRRRSLAPPTRRR